MNKDRWISMNDLCEYLDISRDTALKWIKKGMPAHKIERLWRFKISEVDEWIRHDGCIKPVGEKMNV